MLKIQTGKLIRVVNCDLLWCKSLGETLWLENGQILTVKAVESGSFGNYTQKISTVEGVDVYGADDRNIEVLPLHQKLNELAYRVIKKVFVWLDSWP
jgi:hypothetical protein